MKNLKIRGYDTFPVVGPLGWHDIVLARARQFIWLGLPIFWCAFGGNLMTFRATRP